jgi:peptidoglycan/LPS O-acetylase OafA/YrhL
VGREAVDGGTWWLNAHAEDLTLRRTVADASLFMAGSFMFFSAIWSLKWEIIFSAALPLYLVLGHSGRTIRILLVIASFIAIGSGTSDYLTYLPVFMLGTVLAYEHQHLNRALRGVAPATQACLLAGALLILAVTSWGGDLPAGLPDAIVALGALGVVALASASAGILPALLSRRPVHWLGTRSFSLYLVHEPLLVTLAFATGAGLAPVPFVLIGIPLALVGAEAFYRAIEHPSHRLARRVKSGTVGRRLALAD